MENNSLKTIGKVYSFDGEAGIIITKDGEYLFNISNVKGITNLQKNDTNFERIAQTDRKHHL